jgi:nucleoside-diphosphate-sugar epimerase
MKIFITGASGVIGRRLVPALRGAGHGVTGVARSTAGRAQLEGHGASAVDVDLFDALAVRRAVDGFDTVVNLATHIPPSSTQMLLPWAWRENDRIRHIASGILVYACIAANVPRFIQESFAPVYPDRGEEWIDETVPISPVRYNRTVADAEAAADRVARSGRTGIVLRFGSFYGPDAVQTIDLITWVKRGRAPIPGPASAYISSVSHDDAATAVAAAITLPSGIYNVVDNDPVTHQTFVESLADAIGVAHPKLPPRWVTTLLGSVGEMLARSVRISNRKLRSISGWAPAYASVRQGWPAVLAELSGRSSASRNLALNKSARH